jgi:hypothetical protein
MRAVGSSPVYRVNRERIDIRRPDDVWLINLITGAWSIVFRDRNCSTEAVFLFRVERTSLDLDVTMRVTEALEVKRLNEHRVEVKGALTE